MKIKRRTFLSGLAAAGAACMMPKMEAEASVSENSYATLIDLTKCDGCAGRETPACVTACRTENVDKFPQPKESKIKDYWPQKKHEDWSDKKHLTNRLTPYNWIFVQKITVEDNGRQTTVHVPRRCMHCDSPPCAKLCPFGAKTKTPEGPVYINENLCMGGAKCRAVCPWSVPQRQAGVGIYTYIDPIPAGGGVMYKCDLCRDRLAEGKQPACIEECPQQAMIIGTRKEIFAKAEELKQQYNGYIYGGSEHGGTSTLYVSKVPFEKLDQALVANAKTPKKVMRLHHPDNLMDTHVEKAAVALAAPVAGAIVAFAATISKKEDRDEDK